MLRNLAGRRSKVLMPAKNMCVTYIHGRVSVAANESQKLRNPTFTGALPCAVAAVIVAAGERSAHRSRADTRNSHDELTTSKRISRMQMLQLYLATDQLGKTLQGISTRNGWATRRRKTLVGLRLKTDTHSLANTKNLWEFSGRQALERSDKPICPLSAWQTDSSNTTMVFDGMFINDPYYSQLQAESSAQDLRSEVWLEDILGRLIERQHVNSRGA